MKKRNLFVMAVIFVSFFTSKRAWAQYPQLTSEAGQTYQKMRKELYTHSDSARAAAYPIAMREAQSGRSYVPWVSHPYDLPQTKVPAFPDAEGGDMHSFGGRGGRVITVTNLSDVGPGSFRKACETDGVRTTIFNVAGIIKLRTPIITHIPYVTAVRQTAPGDGICTASESFWMETHDVVVRRICFRRGKTNVYHRDNSSGGNPAGNIMIDHYSCTQGLDENASLYRHMLDENEG